MHVNDVLHRVAGSYLNYDSSYDRGHGYDEESNVIMDFQTFFQRPNKFRMDWIDFDSGQEINRASILSDGNACYSSYSSEQPGQREWDTLQSAMWAATGPELILCTCYQLLFGQQVLARMDLKSVSNNPDLGYPCFKLESSSVQQHQTSIWIRQDDFTIRKIRQAFFMSGEQLAYWMSHSDEFYEQLEGEGDRASSFHVGKLCASEYVYTTVEVNADLPNEVFRNSEFRKIA
jgi:hypothetical protein